ncbi:DUF6731 family protein [Roseburia sp. 499]|uniref:DUF6731 family protein n=1 Tax=Roseburia sp. 499 TaxID=1261634 RepID=UPI000952AE1A|nr:DUF6731 family protein [Roseburia sp. 499]WVK68976.1 DUF6731 family protein [Roseburia sp. 499]
MAQTRKIRIEYFQVVKAPIGGNDSGRLYKLEKLILKANELPPEERIFQYYQEEARLDKFLYNKVDDYWYLNFVRLRQTKLPVRAKKTEEATSMHLAEDEYIGEDVSAVYDCKNHILALQRNRDSLSANGIEQYLTELCGEKDNGIFLLPVPIRGINEKINRAKVFRKFTMKFATATELKKTDVKNTSFSRLFQYLDKFESKTATLTISLGRTRKGTLDETTIYEAIDDINNTDGIVTGAEVSVKYSETDPVDVIDLFTMKYHDFIFYKVEKRESIEFSDLVEQIHMKYNRSKEDILRAINE